MKDKGVKFEEEPRQESYGSVADNNGNRWDLLSWNTAINNAGSAMMSQLHAIAIVVEDYDVAIDFFVNKLDFAVTSDEDLGNGKRWVMVNPPGGGCSLLLARAINDVQCSSVGNQTGGRVGFSLLCDDFDGDCRMMIERGVVFEGGARHESSGKCVVFKDVCGNRWDLLQRKDLNLTCR